MRGASRPMEMDSSEEGAEETDDGLSMLEKHHRQVLWIPWTLILLGIWLVLAPSAFGYGNPDLWTRPAGGRGVWWSQDTHDALRASLTIWSDVVAGILLVVFGARTLRADRPVSMWAACFVGIWLVFAPVVLWSPTASAFANDSLIGTLVIALTILIPGMPNMAAFMKMGPDTPPGWTYNPSSWPQRWILIALGFAGLVVSRYLGAFQLGFIDTVWDPFFGFAGGTEPVLTSEMSAMWPVSDGGLGAVAYTFEFLMGLMGGTARWRTMPWMVTIFGILVIPLGLSHIALVMSQPVVVHHWCTLCLLAAAIMLPMIPLEVDEVVAMGQHLRQARRRGDRGGSTWKIFWLGGEAEGSTPDDRSPPLAELPDRPDPVLRSMVWGMTGTWTLWVSAGLGLWLLAAPSVFGVDIRSGAADLAHIGGAAVVVISVMAMGEVIRVFRFANLVAGAVLVVSAVLAGAGVMYAVAVGVPGLAVAGLAIPRGRVRERYGAWDSVVR